MGKRILLLLFLLSVTTHFLGAQQKQLAIQRPDILVSSIEKTIYLTICDSLDFTKDNIEVCIDNKPQKLIKDDTGVYFISSFNDDSSIQLMVDKQVVDEMEVSPIPLWFSIIPPLIAIIMALITKEVFSALFIGLLVGTTIIYKYQGLSFFVSLFKGLFSVVDTYALAAINDTDHLSIIIFSMLIGGMVALITMNGGMKGIVSFLSRYAKGPKSGQFIAWLMGLMIFFDDYANTLVVGNTMRPVTDKLRISREKLAYIVDSTSAPIASVAFITTWIGAELSYISQGVEKLGINQSAYQVFLNSLSYAFYPVFTLVFVLLVILLKKDFGPMYKAEKQAREMGVDFFTSKLNNHPPQITKEIEIDDTIKGRWYNAFIPVMIVVFGTIAGLLYTGWDNEIWQSVQIGIGKKLSIIIGNADSFKALMWSSLGGVLAALILSTFQRVLALKDAIEGLVNGFKTMFSAVLILVLAWSIALLTEHLHTAAFITEVMRIVKLSPYWVPALAFIFSGLIAFSTGSSWGTMAIIYPLILPASWKISMEFGMSLDEALPIFYNVVSTVLAGSVLGDHCSPISDTTILSSLASSCNHLNHVRTQMPYALLVGVVSLLVGTIPGAYGVPVWILIPVGIAILFFVIKKVGKNVEDESKAP